MNLTQNIKKECYARYIQSILGSDPGTLSSRIATGPGDARFVKLWQSNEHAEVVPRNRRLDDDVAWLFPVGMATAGGIPWRLSGRFGITCMMPDGWCSEWSQLRTAPPVATWCASNRASLRYLVCFEPRLPSLLDVVTWGGRGTWSEISEATERYFPLFCFTVESSKVGPLQSRANCHLHN